MRAAILLRQSTSRRSHVGLDVGWVAAEQPDLETGAFELLGCALIHHDSVKGETSGMATRRSSNP